MTPESIPHRRAWSDWVIDYLEGRSIPFPLVMAGLLALGILFVHVVEWTAGGLPFGRFDFLRATYPCYPVGILSLMAVQRRISLRSLERFRPASGFDEDRLAATARELAYQPAAAVFWLTLLFGALGLVVELSLPRADQRLAEVPVAFAFDVATGFVGYMMLGPWLVGVVRLLRIVNRLHREAPKVDLMNPDPLRAFSSATAFAGLGFVGLLTFSSLTDPDTYGSAAGLFFAAITVAIATASFFLPLWGMHTRLQAERARMLGEVGIRLGSTLRSLYALVDDDRPGATELRDRMLALTAARDLIEKQSSWPWRPETLRWLVSALLVPVAVWGLTRFLEGMGL